LSISSIIAPRVCRSTDRPGSEALCLSRGRRALSKRKQLGKTAVVVIALALAGCSSPSKSGQLDPSEMQTSLACRDINASMIPRTGTQSLTWNPRELSQSPWRKLVAAVDRSSSSDLHAELAAFNAAAKTENGIRIIDESNAMVMTCRRLGFGSHTD
jgi:hypothetical protein